MLLLSRFEIIGHWLETTFEDVWDIDRPPCFKVRKPRLVIEPKHVPCKHYMEVILLSTFRESDFFYSTTLNYLANITAKCVHARICRIYLLSKRKTIPQRVPLVTRTIRHVVKFYYKVIAVTYRHACKKTHCGDMFAKCNFIVNILPRCSHSSQKGSYFCWYAYSEAHV